MARPAPHETLPPAVPRRGNALTRGLGRLVLGLLGWRLEGTFPDLPRFVLVGAPHTSNWDAVVGLAAAMAYVLGVTPEGTRSRAPRWKTGFHHIAVTVGVAVVLVALDYGNKRIGPGPTLTLSGDLPADLARIADFFRDVRGKHPEHFALPAPEQLGEAATGRG